MKQLNIILITFLLIGLNSWIIGQQSQAQPSTQKIVNPQSYITRGPISISGNGQLQPYDPGALGTVDDPIVIENYNITTSGSSPLIYIFGTTLHFRLANNLLNGVNQASKGIELEKVKNGTIFNNTIANTTEYGIALYSCNDSHIFKNIVNNNGASGIQISQSTNVTISNNSIYNNNFQGISFDKSNNNTISNNTAYANEVDGIALYFSDYNTVANNTAWDNNANGIRLENTTDYNKILYNTLSSNGGGVWIGNSCENNTISHNEVKNNNANGIVLTTDSGVGININNTISRNIVSKNRYQGIRLDAESDDNIISYNLIFNNDLAGISIGPASDSNVIHYNDFSGNNPGGTQADDQSINNVFAYNYWSDWDGTGSYSFEGNDDASPQTNPNHLSAPIITAPTSTLIILKDSVTIQWEASSDTFGHPLTYSVFYSTNDGTTWNKILSGLTGTSYNWDLSAIFNGTEVLLKIETEDSLGFISVSVSDSTFIIENPELISTTTTTTTKGTAGWNVLLLILSLIVILPLSHRRRNS
ncbi:MAG: right-handed parallel beta-helix repeat-containing protein [Candidatus Hodarchaeota archaeon]